MTKSSKKPEYKPALLLLSNGEQLFCSMYLDQDNEIMAYRPCKLVSETKTEERDGSIYEVRTLHFAPWTSYSSDQEFFINSEHVISVCAPTDKLLEAYMKHSETIYSEPSEVVSPSASASAPSSTAFFLSDAFTSSRPN